MNRRHHTALSISLAAALGLTACTSSAPDTASSAATTEPSSVAASTEPARSGSADDTAPPPAIAEAIDVDRAIELIADSYAASLGTWSGFDMRAEPVVLAVKDDTGQLLGAIAINHPAVDELGDAVRHGERDDEIGDVFLVTDLSSETVARLAPMDTFDFHAQLGGVDSFAMLAGGTDPFFDPTTLDYGSTLIHEVFHRWQDRAFAGGFGAQDIEGYAYTQDNIALATLEDRVLIAALAAETDDERRSLTRQVAAIRVVRRAADPRVQLDDDQERFEGTARWLEHAQAGTNDGFAYHAGNHGGELVSDPTEAYGIKDHFGFGRFYASGAAIVELAHRLDIEDPAGQVGDGASPVDLLIDAFGITESDAAAVVDEARAQHDPDNELPGLAADAARQAEDEPGVFDEIGDGG